MVSDYCELELLTGGSVLVYQRVVICFVRSPWWKSERLIDLYTHHVEKVNVMEDNSLPLRAASSRAQRA